MPIYFRSTPVSAPYMFDSIGNHWIRRSEHAARKAILTITICRQKVDAERLRYREKSMNYRKMRDFS